MFYLLKYAFLFPFKGKERNRKNTQKKLHILSVKQFGASNNGKLVEIG